MSNLRDIKQRIGSIKKTQKITQAMKMVSAAKFKRAETVTIEQRPYSADLESIFTCLSCRVEPDKMPVYFHETPNKPEALILITGDRGLCGGFNSNNIRFTESFLKEQKNDPQLYCIGKRGYKYFKSRPWEIKKHLEVESSSPEEISALFSEILDRFSNQEISKVWLLYTPFENALSMNVQKTQLLPLELKIPEDHYESDYFYDPSSVIDEFVNHYLTYNFTKAITESRTAEEGARMTAMDSATDNARDMIRALTLVYNRKRQSVITTELNEIVGGAEALVS